MITENQSKAVDDIKSHNSIFSPYERHGTTAGILLRNDYDVNIVNIKGGYGYAGTHVPIFVHKLGLIKPRQT